MTNIGDRAFYRCNNLISIVVESGNSKYDSRDNCNAIIETSSNELIIGCKNTVIPNGVTSIGDRAFEECSGLTSITIPNGVTSIGQKAFNGCYGLTSVTIGNSVTIIGDNAFYRCSSLSAVTIGRGVTSIGDWAFSECLSLTSVISEIVTPFAFGVHAFYAISAECVLNVPYGKKSEYISAGWTEDVFKGGIFSPVAQITLVETITRHGLQATIPVHFESELAFGGLQCEVILPEGVTLNKVTKTERLSEAFTLTKSLTGENTYQILLYNIERATFAGTDGALFNMVVNIDENIVADDYEIQVKEIVASDVDGNETALPNVNGVLHVAQFLTGDANNDGKINVTDIMAVASYILKYDVPGFIVAAADVNGDGKINVTDIMGIANIILQPNNANNAPMLQMEEQNNDEIGPE